MRKFSVDGGFCMISRIRIRKATKTTKGRNRSDNPQKDFQELRRFFQEELGQAPELVFRPMQTGGDGPAALLVYLEGIVDKKALESGVIEPFLQGGGQGIKDLSSLRAMVLQWPKSKILEKRDEMVQSLLTGSALLFLQGQPDSLAIATAEWKTRSVKEPDSEMSVRGPREGFIESLEVNMGLIRRKLVNQELRFEILTVGRETRTKVCIAYIRNIAVPAQVEEVRKRIGSIQQDLDSVLDSGYIEVLIEDEPWSIFPTVGNTEKPDRFVSKLLQGRVGILVDGTPMALTVPYLFIEGFQSVEDYYSRPYYSSFVRLLRFFAFFLSVVLPAFYISTQNYHNEMIPTPLLISMVGTRQQVPLPAGMEIVLMIIAFEFIREAGVRMPKAVGQAVSIVGALVLGQAAVEAGIVGAHTVIVVALIGITSFVVPAMTDSMGLLRLLLLIPSLMMGLFGLLGGMLVLLTHLASLRSLGVPYLYPIAPMKIRKWGKVFLSIPLRQYRKWAKKPKPVDSWGNLL